MTRLSIERKESNVQFTGAVEYGRRCPEDFACVAHYGTGHHHSRTRLFVDIGAEKYN